MITPLEEYPDLAKAIGCSGLYFKREDLHPYKSHKGRSIPIMIDMHYASGARQFVISSSGNAALAAALHIQKINASSDDIASLDIYVGIHIAPHKLEKLKKLTDEHIRVLSKERPLQALTQASLDGATSLRQSIDDTALVGYEALARELAETPDIGAIFIGTSSGTTAQALSAYMSVHHQHIQVHIIQTSSCHVMSDAFDTYDGPEERSIADAIVDITAQRKSKLIPLIEKTGGRGWFATNEEIRTTQELAQKHANLEISTNSALSIVGAMQATYTGYEIEGKVVCMICGE